MELLSNKATNDQLSSSEWNGSRKEVENIITDAGLTLDAGDQNQLGKAIADYLGNADFYTDSGTANAHVLTSVSSNQPPTAYKDGMRVRYRVNVTNTGATTVAVAGLTAKAVTINNIALAGGELIAGESVTLEYHGSNGKFNIVLTEAVAGYRVNGYSLTTGAYDSKSFDVSTQDVGASGVFFKDDGLKMYMLGIANDTVYQYSLSTAWDVSTATYDSVSLDISTQSGAASGLFIGDSGSKLYVVDNVTDDVFQYTLSTAWSLTGASYASKFIDVNSEEPTPLGLFFKPDGAKMYVVGQTNDAVYQYTLSIAWDVSTATYDTVSLSVTGQDTLPTGLFFKSDGTKMYMLGQNNDIIYQYTLPTPWVLTGAVYDSISFNVGGQDSSPQDIFFKPDGDKLYMIGNTNDTVYQYSTNFLSAPL